MTQLYSEAVYLYDSVVFFLILFVSSFCTTFFCSFTKWTIASQTTTSNDYKKTGVKGKKCTRLKLCTGKCK